MFQTLPKRKMFRYCLADVAKGLFNGMIGNYLIYFFQPTAASGLPGLLPQNRLFGFITVMALLTGIGKIIDAVTDPLVASLSDRCSHPDGRRMPFLRYAAVPYALSVLLIFYAPFPAGSAANAVWVGVFLFAYYTAYTFFFIPRNALVPEIIPDAKERVVHQHRIFYGLQLLHVRRHTVRKPAEKGWTFPFVGMAWSVYGLCRNRCDLPAAQRLCLS